MNSLFYRNVRLLILTIVVIFVWGLSSFFSLPRMEDPEMTPRFATITTGFPGASPERVESLVTDKLEASLFEVEEIKNVTSTSQLGFSTVSVELNDNIDDVDPVWSQVRDKINDVIPQLPATASTPEFDTSKAKANALILALTWDLDTAVNYGILSRWAEELDDQLRLIGGTEKVEQFGNPEEEIIIEVDPKQLTNLGLTVSSLSQQILDSDAKVSAGQLRSQQSRLLFEITGELDSLDRLNGLPIQSSQSSQVVRLGDIAAISKGIADPPAELAIINGRPAIAISAFVESQQRLDSWAAITHKKLQSFEQQLPHGIALETIFDQSDYVEARLNEVLGNLALGAILVIAITFVVMGWKSSFIVGMALPLSVLMVFGSMKLLGVPLHQISITGLIIALGLLIDNAIIVVDEVQTYLQKGLSPQKAVATTIGHIFTPLLASTFTSVLAFIPIATAPGGTGEFTGTIGVTVILALISSLILALTVIPALAGRLHRWQPTSTSGHWWETGFSHRRLTKMYRWSLDRTFSRPLLTMAVIFILPLWGFIASGHLQQQFFPPTDRGQFYLNFELPIQTALPETQSQAMAARELILRHPEVTDVQWFLGKSAPPFYYNVIQNRENSPNYGQAIVQLKPKVQSRPLIQALQSELDEAFPQAQVILRQLEQGPPFDAPIELRLYGSDLNTLRNLGDELRAELAQTPNVIHTRATLTEALPKLGLNLDEEQLRLVGLDKSTIGRQLDSSLEGTVGGSILEGTEELPVRVRTTALKRGNLADISSLTLLTQGEGEGSIVPLSAVGDVTLIPDVVTISRRNGKRTNTVQGFIPAGMLPDQVLSDFEARLKARDFSLPPGYSWDFGGEQEERGNALSNVISTVGVLLIMMMTSLVLTFKSFRLAGIILMVAMLSMGLGLGSLALFDYPFGFTAILGIIGLLGVVVNDSIVVLSSLNHDSEASRGDRRAARNVVITATRHVVATTLTTILGFTPLLFDPSGFWPPLAITIVGGLAGATLIALYFVPSAYLFLKGRKFSMINRQKLA
ncbi:efflux RND transporter permease subunit [Crocosphaera sp.]|uniref:efflux RND transporter permease subunit n=1 Tax=Crocosphaera sp. TaxID=2729996 RepID=UPI003F22EC9C|nr:efflux RND transporter permease subunit [Crocosphaera sp.]